MLNNYEYFIALAEEQSISKAADRLFISHQGLSRYLKRLEAECQVELFEHSSKLKLTAAGELYLNMLRNIEFLERNWESQLQHLRTHSQGVIRIGTTLGRYRQLFPDIMAEFKKLYPDVTITPICDKSSALKEKLLKNELDLVLLPDYALNTNRISRITLFTEKLFFAINDDMLRQFFPDTYPQCIRQFSRGITFEDMARIPLVVNDNDFASRDIVEQASAEENQVLNIAMEINPMDLHLMLTARGIAASFVWSMYLQIVEELNQSPGLSHTHVFPICGVEEGLNFCLMTVKGRILPPYGNDLVALIKKMSQKYQPYCSESYLTYPTYL